ncbi:tRNA (cytosine(32)/uridine(32)-2'-O)-methyltransferase TrmJ [Neptunomonas phycophila]|jgi:tRNA (cytidine32/uridine32-2'-O)-methyltransferase|uniref:tRNA (cytidine/uridine-2'-O-)-methyltransferase TrmJ n=1 Tax=Neptunomonas phycophila TaxID=1572645 RepID=A0AAW7XM85_9GAMM|nr:tRNA (cytosine(32)/uridine(32)-2'-O)-methyltransferase TrmJ [Neptunomonas phycophila]MBT3145012.1 tRNA (cytosine(32)/uridine(32)-2'-O)-methyltransferase TrmJ [Neptunomonas phycophila]MDO6455414.1 tRNA (cytosine(32)/uridine(32)-2'-O)-methyltransferase TrmJ [Neptunomonas phycophila]MDO6785936.1 tRNA (cytosine(32)/uridine(32)-2'-O)-methyltransferase TrmJ [Neptunomonas phycophila]MDP2524400.1 tRNA (cytosine(32)/uridine(32)-2'-O)-methyltransferase TrmJ [Neptunomonas phycophila]
MLSNVRIVLINTFHPGNIGAAARAMKNMGLTNLWLVDPQEYPHPEADSRAAGAKDVLDAATVVNTLEEAIADCQMVVGTSARSRTFDLPIQDARTCAKQVIEEAPNGNIAIVFGRETMGLLNEEIQMCNYHVYIPANPEYPVLNVAQAIQLLCYEVWVASQDETIKTTDYEYPRQKEMTLFYTHLETVLRTTQFLIPQHEGRAMAKLKRYFNRTRPEKAELGMLRGILSSVQDTLKRQASGNSDKD